MSHKLALIPSDVRQTPVPLSSDRRSYYFLIALVARVPRDRLHHVTDSSVNTASPKVTEWALTTAMPSSRLSSHLSPDICLSLSLVTLVTLNLFTLPSPDTPGQESPAVGLGYF